MMARRIFARGVIGLLAGGASIVLAGCGMFGGAKSYRFRMTVEVETPEGLKTGSGVLEVTARKIVALTSEERAGSAGVLGEAVAVDLSGGPVFVLLKQAGKGQALVSTVTHALAPDALLSPIENFVAAVGELASGEHRGELPRADWPLMVRFGDIADPKSVKQVDPEALGVTRIVLETTSDDVTVGIRNRLKWMGEFPESRLDRDYRGSTNPTIAQKLSNGDFRQGTN